MTIRSYADIARPHLDAILEKNHAVMEGLAREIKDLVCKGGSLFVFGSGHSSMLSMELYHRAGGANYIVPIFGSYLMPHAGPPVVRVTERTPGAAIPLLYRADPKPGEMIWIMSQSGINYASLDMALEAKKLGLKTVAFTSVEHSKKASPRHSSGKRLFEVSDSVIDLGGVHGDAAVEVSPGVFSGPLSSLGAIFLAHSIVVEANRHLEMDGHHVVYTSVNTAGGESRNVELEKKAMQRDPLLRAPV